jgi:hypothetical protein
VKAECEEARKAYDDAFRGYDAAQREQAAAIARHLAEDQATIAPRF